MQSWIRRWVQAAVILAAVFVPVRAVQAQENPFTVGMNVTYVVDEQANTRVRYEVRVKNNFSTVYAKEYALQINSPDVADVSVKNSAGKNEAFVVNQTGQGTNITVQFNPDEKIIGRDKERLFLLEYSSKDMASTYGQVMEVTIPKLAEPEKFQQYTVIVMVPERFGNPSRVQPNQFTLDSANGFRVLRFTNVGQSTGISLLFGNSQTYDLNLTYHVVNTSQNVGVVQVALPPDTAFQRVWYEQLTPQPEALHRDADGNWIGEFRVAGQAEQVIQAKGQVTVSAAANELPLNDDPLKSSSKRWRLDTPSYLQPQGFWPSDHPSITAIAATTKTPREIYQYVVDTLQYNYQRLQQDDASKRLGALGALQDPANAMCQEFTDVFVTVARAAGVPARRATGYAVTQNSRLRPLSLVADVLHAWPEYFDQQRHLWVPIDPTWGDTTGGVDYFSQLDLRHITFAYQGMSDTLPLPAGLYKLPGKEEKDIVVTLASADRREEGEKQPLEVEKSSSIFPRWGVPTEVVLLVKNPSGAARYNVQVALGLEGSLELLSPAVVTLPVLLPYQSQEVRVQLSGSDWLQPSRGTLAVLIGNERYAYELTSRRAFTNPIVRWVVMGGSLALVSAVTGSVLVFGLQRLRFVRR